MLRRKAARSADLLLDHIGAQSDHAADRVLDGLRNQALATVGPVAVAVSRSCVTSDVLASASVGRIAIRVIPSSSFTVPALAFFRHGVSPFGCCMVQLIKDDQNR